MTSTRNSVRQDISINVPNTDPPPVELSPAQLEEFLQQVVGMGRPTKEMLQKRVHSIFQQFDDRPDASPIHRELVEFASRLPEIFKELDRPAGLDPHTAHELLERLGPDEDEAGLRVVLTRLKEETDYFHELQDVNLHEAVMLRDFDEKRSGPKIEFLPADSPTWQKIPGGQGAKAVYHRLKDKVYIKATEVPSAHACWELLASAGVLPEFYGILDHELVHAHQTSSGQRAMYYGSMAAHLALSTLAGVAYLNAFAGIGMYYLLKPAQELLAAKALSSDPVIEIHAFEAAASSPSFSSQQKAQKDAILQNLVMSYGFHPADIPRMEVAYNLVHNLRLLGLDDRELGMLVSRDRFDPDTGTYPFLHARMVNECQHQRISPATFPIYMDALDLKHRIESDLNRHRAASIAAEELQKAVEERRQ